MKTAEIRIRDPFVLYDKKDKKYYMYGTNNSFELGFYAYSSDDLNEWSGPFKVFSPSHTFWGTQDFWAPEVFNINDEYFMFASFKSKDHCRGCQILKSASPLGPFLPHSDIVTPKNRECLDGSLYFLNEKPYLIFVHEWLQIGDGEICIIELSKDLKQSIGKPKTLFKASEASWSKHPNWYHENINVCDGPFVVYDENKFPLLLWSSFLEDTYDIGYSYSDESLINGKFEHSKNPIPIKDAGHGMVFEGINKEKYLCLHASNSISGHEYPVFIPIMIKNKEISLK